VPIRNAIGIVGTQRQLQSLVDLEHFRQYVAVVGLFAPLYRPDSEGWTIQPESSTTQLARFISIKPRHMTAVAALPRQLLHVGDGFPGNLLS
jgi:hypothetical protein